MRWDAPTASTARTASTNCGCAAKCPLTSSGRWRSCGRGLRRPYRNGCRCAISSGCPASTRSRWDLLPSGKGRSNIYLVLLDYHDRGTYGIYVGMSKYSSGAALRSAQGGYSCGGQRVEAGPRGADGPTLHLQYIKRSEAARIEEELARGAGCGGVDGQGRSLIEFFWERGLILIGMFDSPFVRRVAVSMNLLGDARSSTAIGRWARISSSSGNSIPWAGCRPWCSPTARL